MSKPVTRPCPVCGHRQGKGLHALSFTLPDGHPLPARYEVVACTQCGFGYADTPASQADYDRYYASFAKYADNQTAIGSGTLSWDAERLAHTAAQIAACGWGTQARLLDVGCTTGGLLSALRRHGFARLCGLDLSPACVVQTQRQGFEAHTGALLPMPAAVGQFDGVILSHVLEHVREVKAALQSVWTLLQPGGGVYIEVPDPSRYADDIRAPFQEFSTEHINHFSLASLVNLMRPVGFELQTSGRKTVALTPERPYPVGYSFWTKIQPQANGAPTYDEQLEIDLRAYIQQSKVGWAALEAELQAALTHSPQIIVWGTGELTLKLLAETSLGQAPIVAFVDSNPVNQGQTLRQVPVVAPDRLRDLRHPILVATTLHQREITDTIHRMGLPNPIIRLRPISGETTHES